MLGVFNTITVNNKVLYRGNDMSLEREWIYAGEYETCNGAIRGDVVGWRFKDMAIEWDTLPQKMLGQIIALSGQAVNMTFVSETEEEITERVIPKASAAEATRFTGPDGFAIWKGVKLELQFVDAHNEGI